MTSQSKPPARNDPQTGIKKESYSQSPGHNVRSRTLPNGHCEVIQIVDGYEEKVTEARRLWATTHRNRPLSIAVRLGLEASAVRRILGLNEPEEDGFNGETWNPEDNL